MTSDKPSLRTNPRRLRDWAILAFITHFCCILIDCRNIRERSRHKRPRADPHVVTTFNAQDSPEFKAKSSNQPRGRRCQITKIEEKARLFELPYYNEGRAILPFFFKISRTAEWKKGKN